MYKVFYTNWFVPARFSAVTYGPFIFIRPTKRDNVGLLEHEKVHVKQFWKNPFMGVWYYFSKEARLKYEAAAYREQLKYSPGNEEVFAQLLVDKYNLGITKEEALSALKGN
jgi:hypothetical protein